MFLNRYAMKIKGKLNMSTSTECLFVNDNTDPEQEINEQMLNLSLTSKQPPLKEELDGKICVKDLETSENMANDFEIPIPPGYSFQHDFSNHYQRTRYQKGRGIHRKSLNQYVGQLREMFSKTKGSQNPSNGDLNSNFNFDPYQEGLSGQFHPTEPESFRLCKIPSLKKSRRDFIRFHHRFFKGRNACDRTHDSALLLSRENQI